MLCEPTTLRNRKWDEGERELESILEFQDLSQFRCCHIDLKIFVFEHTFHLQTNICNMEFSDRRKKIKPISKVFKSFWSFPFQDLSQLLQAWSSLAMGKLFPTIAILNFLLLLFKFTLSAVGHNIIRKALIFLTKF